MTPAAAEPSVASGASVLNCVNERATRPTKGRCLDLGSVMPPCLSAAGRMRFNEIRSLRASCVRSSCDTTEKLSCTIQVNRGERGGLALRSFTRDPGRRHTGHNSRVFIMRYYGIQRTRTTTGEGSLTPTRRWLAQLAIMALVLSSSTGLAANPLRAEEGTPQVTASAPPLPAASEPGTTAARRRPEAAPIPPNARRNRRRDCRDLADPGSRSKVRRRVQRLFRLERSAARVRRPRSRRLEKDHPRRRFVDPRSAVG